MRALAIQEETVGPDHSDVAMALNNLAIVYSNKGDTPRALETHFRALKIWEQAAGPYAVPTLVSLGNIARTYARIGDIPNAIEFQRRADTVIEKQLFLNIAIGSERQKLAFTTSDVRAHGSDHFAQSGPCPAVDGGDQARGTGDIAAEGPRPGCDDGHARGGA